MDLLPFNSKVIRTLLDLNFCFWYPQQRPDVLVSWNVALFPFTSPNPPNILISSPRKYISTKIQVDSSKWKKITSNEQKLKLKCHSITCYPEMCMCFVTWLYFWSGSSLYLTKYIIMPQFVQDCVHGLNFVGVLKRKYRTTNEPYKFSKANASEYWHFSNILRGDIKYFFASEVNISL